MSIGLVADEGSVFIEKEATEGVYTPEAASESAVEVLSDGLEFTPTKELLERNNRTSTVEKVVGRVGQKSMAGTIPVEFKAGSAEGQAPETSALYEALLGGKDILTEVTSLTGNTASKIAVADNTQYKVGHIVKIKEFEASGSVDHVSPIKALTSTSGVTGGAPVTMSINGGEATVQAAAANAATWGDYSYYTGAGEASAETITFSDPDLQTSLDNWNAANVGYELEVSAGNPNAVVSGSATWSGQEPFNGTVTEQDAIELLVPYHTSFSDGVKIAAATVYYHKSGQPTLSVTNYLGGEIREKAIGMRCVSGEISNFSTGQLPQVSFSLEGLDYAREVGQPLSSPAYDSSLPPVVLCSKIYQDDTEFIVNNVSVSMSNTLGFLTSTASCSGKISSRITEFVTTFSCNPYMSTDDTEQFDKFNKNEGYSLFGSSQNYGASEDEYKEVVAVYMPNCRTTEIATGDEDGILTDAISGQAYKDQGNDTIFISFI